MKKKNVPVCIHSSCAFILCSMQSIVAVAYFYVKFIDAVRVPLFLTAVSVFY